MFTFNRSFVPILCCRLGAVNPGICHHVVQWTCWFVYNWNKRWVKRLKVHSMVILRHQSCSFFVKSTISTLVLMILVLCTPLCKIGDFLTIWTLIVACRSLGNGDVVCIRHSGVLLLSGSADVGLQCEQEGAEHTALGGSMLSINLEEVWLPIHTPWCLLVGKFNIPMQRLVLKPWVFSYPISFVGEIVFKAELKSTNNILM